MVQIYKVGSLQFVDNNDNGVFDSKTDKIKDAKGVELSPNSPQVQEVMRKCGLTSIEGFNIKYMAEKDDKCETIMFLKDTFLFPLKTDEEARASRLASTESQTGIYTSYGSEDPYTGFYRVHPSYDGQFVLTSFPWPLLIPKKDQ